MLKFLSNNFHDARWRTAALKNAFALLSKQRYGVFFCRCSVPGLMREVEYAAAFFLLGGSLKDAVNVCLKQMDDFQLAIAIARVVEGCNEGPILTEILSETVIPGAFEAGNRYLGSWAFWVLHRRDLAVRVLLVSPTTFPKFGYTNNILADVLDTPSGHRLCLQRDGGRDQGASLR